MKNRIIYTIFTFLIVIGLLSCFFGTAQDYSFEAQLKSISMLDFENPLEHLKEFIRLLSAFTEIDSFKEAIKALLRIYNIIFVPVKMLLTTLKDIVLVLRAILLLIGVGY